MLDSDELGLYEAMSTLRAVRRLRPDPIPDAVLRRLVEAASWGPTGGNRQPWRVILVRDAERKRALGELYRAVWAPYVARTRLGIARAPEASRARSEKMLAAGDHLAEHFGEIPVIAVFCFNPAEMAITDAHLERPSVVGGASVYPSVQNFLLAARAEGLGCVLTTLLCQRESEVKSLLLIPADWHTCAAVPLGRPLLRGHGPLTRRPPEKLAFSDGWGRAFE
jgi:nitroreductase